MNTSDPGSNITSPSPSESFTLSSLTAGLSPSVPAPSDTHDPVLTIMVVLGLFLLLAALAAFLAVCRPSGQEGDSEGGCGPGEGLARGSGLSSEPQLKVWKRLGSYRRTYNISFRRPPHRRPQEQEHTHASQSLPARQTLQPESSVEPHLTMPCLFDYVTEI
ncbi:uncharacterized protein C10orf105-like [Polymixia lowei]